MSHFSFVLDASSLEKGVGNIKRWCEESTSDSSPHVTLNLYIPTFTIQELDFLRYKRKSYAAKESLKFIDSIETNENVDVIIEFPDLLDTITWFDVLKFQQQPVPEYEMNGTNSTRALPRRFKNLLKSCIYKCHLESGNDETWSLIAEDPQVRKLATAFQIPTVSLLEADNMVSMKTNKQAFKQNQKFNKYLKKKSTKEVNAGKEIYKTKFDSMVYAPRGSGDLWLP